MGQSCSLAFSNFKKANKQKNNNQCMPQYFLFVLYTWAPYHTLF